MLFQLIFILVVVVVVSFSLFFFIRKTVKEMVVKELRKKIAEDDTSVSNLDGGK